MYNPRVKGDRDAAPPLPPLTALRSFEAAARHLSFTRAAEELHVTQTAISHQVKLLEGQLGTVLFRRLPRRIVLRLRLRLALPRAQHGSVLARLIAGVR